ncbi:hypothetical protein AVEN_28413-1 [Araneus ventricosus]|uniref:Uncharacterized protein n=1 Tax=Araneus ventricosus TaxID=182803 RepID=A0A4Y2K0Z8_ARAVE|nr:hypothetical protein AVEN_15304-1 [Araneus ventricosus]GBM95113.1 hypothetical protein AVEN_28413-1 [Araneus ventricosus]
MEIRSFVRPLDIDGWDPRNHTPLRQLGRNAELNSDIDCSMSSLIPICRGFEYLSSVNFLLVKMSGVKRKRNVLNVKQKLEILQKHDNGESASTDAEDVLNEGNTISHSTAIQSVETLLDYMGQRGFDYGDVTAVRKYVSIYDKR